MKRALIGSLAIFISIVLSPAASARVFDITQQSFAAYVRGTIGPSLLKQDAFANSDGPGTKLSGKSSFDYTGEFGFLFPLTNQLNVRFGLQLFQSSPVADSGYSPSGVKRFDLKSDVFVYAPVAALEYAYDQLGNTRFLVSAGAGYADVTVDNDYKMAPTSDLSTNDFTEKMHSSVINGFVSLGVETQFTDTATVMLDFGYRYFPVRSLSYKSNVTSFAASSGASQGDTVKNSDGTTRKLDLGGIFAGIAFRFYIH